MGKNVSIVQSVTNLFIPRALRLQKYSHYHYLLILFYIMMNTKQNLDVYIICCKFAIQIFNHMANVKCLAFG